MKILKRITLFLFVLSALCIGVGYIALRKSLPIVSGQAFLEGLTATLLVERDVLGIPTIHGQARLDVARATGFLHAQDRYFQMDLMRRAAAGELAEIFGTDAVEFDKSRRFHRLRKRAGDIYQNLSPSERTLLETYVEGVNSGLRSLTVHPFEYLLMGATPKPWAAEDSLLVCLGLFFGLQDSEGDGVIDRMVMKQTLPSEVCAFFINNGTAWDAALDDTKLPILVMPQRDVFGYLEALQGDVEYSLALLPALGGSNQWAVTGKRSYHGKALLACDMHLELTLPTSWYRAAFVYPEGDEMINLTGATMPGTPMMIIGSNTHIAWGFTNGYISTTDLVGVDASTIETVVEIIHVKDALPVSYEIRESDWGPLLPENLFGELFALRWIAHRSDALNLQLIELEKARDVGQALEKAKEIKIPILNFMVADSVGNIAWTLVGGIPDFNSGALISTSSYPVIVNPPAQALWTANNRTLGGEWLDRVGHASFISGIRAHQIRERLLVEAENDETDMLALQLEVQAPFFDRWRQLLVSVLESSATTENRKELLMAIKGWNGRCDADSTGYHWIREFREMTMAKVLRRILAPCFSARKGFLSYFQDFEEPVWLIVSQQPDYLVDPQFSSWREELLGNIDLMIAGEAADIKSRTWGQSNPLIMRHPFTLAMPFLGAFLNMAEAPMSGDFFVPKVARLDVGASQRMVVSPGAEDRGIFQLPGGQSGHPLSPFYSAGHNEWLEGRSAPFLPGAPVYVLQLLPGLNDGL